MGVDKTALTVGGRTLLEVARDALVGAGRTVVVGPGGDLVEDPPGSGPVPALAAGLAVVGAPVVVVLAADLPFVTAAAVEALAAAAPACAVDDGGRPQWLLAAYPAGPLRAACTGNRLGDVARPLAPQHLRLDGDPPPWWDCDTPAELTLARATAAARSGGSAPR